MAKTIEKYQTFSFGALEVNQSEEETQNNYQEYLKLQAGVDELQRSQRNLLGEDLGNLGTNELEQLENQLDSSLKHIRPNLHWINSLNFKGSSSVESHNSDLPFLLEETTAAIRLSWKAGDERVPYSFQHFQPYDSVEPLQYSSTSQIGYVNSYQPCMNPNENHSVCSAPATFRSSHKLFLLCHSYNPAETDQATATTSTQNVNGFIPGWML
ncbi:hypothetical protein DKX38_012707 [Salix brachista]|uniref:K-box domain-containing protein n=1 Tax=Salix brachista TaxID=2182728 RepID=A0A5N5LP60_9ROSI|nr:hypothetical protein DKX38_012707 [Salix brachista]